MGPEHSAFHAGPEDRPPTKAESIRVDHIVISLFACNKAADHTFQFADSRGRKRVLPFEFVTAHLCGTPLCETAVIGRSSLLSQTGSVNVEPYNVGEAMK
jgi:hypothetical protein